VLLVDGGIISFKVVGIGPVDVEVRRGAGVKRVGFGARGKGMAILDPDM